MPTQQAILQLRNAMITYGAKYRNDFIVMPQAVLAKSLQYMTKVTGLHGKEIHSKIKSNAQYKPYQPAVKNVSNTTTFETRELETYLCELLEEFDPYQIYGSVYDQPLKVKRINLEMVRKIVAEMSRSACDKFTKALWTGVRNPSGLTAMDTFDGIDTIIEKEKTGGYLTKALGNYFQIGKLTEYNIVDKLRLMWMQMDSKLKDKEKIYLYMPTKLRELYENGYAIKYSTAQFTGQFTQKYLIGSDQRCEIVNLPGMEDVKHILFTTKDNIHIGFDGDESGEETFEINKPDNPKLVQIFGTSFIGAQIMNLEKEFMFCASFSANYEVPYLEYDPESLDFGSIVAETDKTLEVDIKGYNLTTSLAIAVTGTGFSTTAGATMTAANAALGQTLSIKLDPSTTGDFTGMLTIKSATDFVDVEIPLKGKCVAAPAGD